MWVLAVEQKLFHGGEGGFNLGGDVVEGGGLGVFAEFGEEMVELVKNVLYDEVVYFLCGWGAWCLSRGEWVSVG